MRLIFVLALSLISNGCTRTVIVSVGECERGIVTKQNVQHIKEVWPEADITDVLISGGCYQDKHIKKIR